MNFQSQLMYKLTLGAFLMLCAHTTATMLSNEASLNNRLQRSPSLRLRFGRRSDPDLLPQVVEKRWFGDVNKKPIRSPSLRLRYGRRSDPSMPMHSAYDILMNPEYNEDYKEVYDAYFNRMVRNPQPLRFERSLPFHSLNAANDDGLLESGDDFYNNLMHSRKLRHLLMSLNNNDDNPADEAMNTAEGDMDDYGYRARGMSFKPPKKFSKLAGSVASEVASNIVDHVISQQFDD